MRFLALKTKNSHLIFRYFLLSIILFSTACSEVKSSKSQVQSYLHSASLMTIKPSDSYFLARQYVGKISAKQYAKMSFEYKAAIKQVYVDNGDYVIKGQLLAEQDTQLLAIRVVQLKAKISQINTKIKLKEANLKRLKRLITDGYTSEQNLDELVAQQQVLTAQSRELSATVQIIDYQITKAKLLAPFDGVVGERLISKGEVIAAGMTVFRLIETNNNEIKLGVPSKLAKNLTLGDNYLVEIGLEQSQAKLIAIGRQVNAINRTVQLRLKLDKNISSLNGQLVKVTIKQQVDKQGYWLPLTAITDGIRGQWNLFLANKNSSGNFQLEAVTIKVLHTTQDSVYISGLTQGQHTIIAKGLHRLVPGQMVKQQNSKLSATVNAKDKS